jgi:cytochrome c-type biogenesis protein CcmH
MFKKTLTPLVALALMALSPLFLPTQTAQAGEAENVYKDPAFEARFKSLAGELRCVKCQNQTILDSPAGVAQDLRREITEQIQTGKSDSEIIDYLVSRYGDYIRYRPELKPSTYLLWFGPFLLLAGGLAVLFINLARRRKAIDESTPLSEEERMRIESLLSGNKGGEETR